MTSLFATARTINSATKIPPLGWQDRIRLVRTGGVSAEALRAGGARKTEKCGWFILRDEHVVLHALEPYLPQLAKPSIIPNVVDLIPATSWGASLANILTPGSWKRVRDGVVNFAGGCEDCGVQNNLECHEIWSYDEEIGVQTLVGLRSVCDACHETYHLGFARVNGRYAAALERLATINRIAKKEIERFESEIVEKFISRSEIEWTLDLTAIAGSNLSLKTKFALVAPGTIQAQGKAGEVQVSIQGVKLEHKGKGLVLR